MCNSGKWEPRAEGRQDRSRSGGGGRRPWRMIAAVLGLAVALAPVTDVGSSGNPASAATGSGGGVSAFGDATAYSAPPGSQLNAPVTGIGSTPDHNGYWLVGGDGGVFNYGDAGFYGSGVGTYPYPLVGVVGIAPTPDGRGYWIADHGGYAFTFGDAPDENPTLGLSPNAPVVGIAPVPHALGYWLAGADGGVFSLGAAGFHGSMGGTPLNAAVVGIAPTADGRGYWLVAADGGVFSFGDAGFHGSMGGQPLDAAVVGIAPTADGRGYWLVAADGGVFSFGDATFHGSLGAAPPSSDTPVVGMAATPDGNGYWLATTDKSLPPPTPVPSVPYDCNQPSDPAAVEPSSISLACADGNSSLIDLTWSSWTATSALASGQFTYNLCHPDCAGGTFVTYPASVWLGYPVETSVGEEFSAVRYSYADPSAPGGWSTFTQLLETSPS